MASARKMADKAISSGANLVEIRADLTPGSDAVSIKNHFSDILGISILTLRSRSEGGKSDLIANEREKWNEDALALKAAYVDLEHDADRRLISSLGEKRNRTIISKHYMDSWGSEEVSEMLSDCCKLGEIGKVAAKIDNVVEGIRLLESIKNVSSAKFSLMGMGQGAELTRALAGPMDAELIYCMLDKESTVAPGQLTLEAQKRVLSRNSIVVGLIGHPLDHTLSPGMQNAAFERLNVPGIYLPFDVPEASQIPSFLRSCAKLGLRGCNVTIPYKEAAFSAVDQLDDEARRVKAVNTVLVQNDKSLKGFNTDIFGFSESIRVAGFNPRNKRTLIVGAGGGSRAAVIGLWKMGAKIVIANRTPERAEELVRSMRVFVKTLSLDALVDEKPFSLIVNATPVGMRGFEISPIVPERLIERAEAVMDMVYNPLETPLIAAAKKNGVKTIHGLNMLLYQGAKAFEIWTGERAPIEEMRKELMGAIR